MVVLHGINHFSLLERAAPVGVDHAEDRTRRVQELDAELLVGRGRRLGAPLLLGRQLLQALREAALDGLVPFGLVDLAALVRVQDLQRLLQPRRVQ